MKKPVAPKTAQQNKTASTRGYIKQFQRDDAAQKNLTALFVSETLKGRVESRKSGRAAYARIAAQVIE